MFMQKNCQKNYLDYLQQSLDRKSTRLNSSHLVISYAVFCLKKKMSKYVNKKSDMDLAAKSLGAKEWNKSLQTKLSLLPKKLFRIRTSRNFGMKMLTMTNLSTECLIQLSKLGYDATPFNQILKQNAKRFFFLNNPAPPEIYPFPPHPALPI